VLEVSRSLASKIRPQQLPEAPGAIEVRSAVVAETFSHHRLTLKGVERFLQVQVRVQNKSGELRAIMVTDRALSCAAGSTFSWLAGADEAISGLSSGPVEIAPGAWTVFSQRLGGRGNPAACTVSLEIADILRAPGAAAWVTHRLKVVKAALEPVAHAEY
jgi:hypothetical protein